MALDQQTGDVVLDAGQSTEALVTWVLLAATSASKRTSVRKTTLAALLEAMEEEAVDEESFADLLDALSRVHLADALLSMRERGVLQLTDAGFTLVDQVPAPTADSKVQTWLTGLVSKKFQEWQLKPVLA